MASKASVSLTNETVTAATANDSALLLAQYLVGPTLIAKTACGTVSAAPRTASHDACCYLVQRNPKAGKGEGDPAVAKAKAEDEEAAWIAKTASESDPEDFDVMKVWARRKMCRCCN